MAGSHAMERRKKAADRKAAGITLDASGKEKKINQEKMTCKLCTQEFRVTKKNVEPRVHWESKHAKVQVCSSLSPLSSHRDEHTHTHTRTHSSPTASLTRRSPSKSVSLK